ncbi:MAG TPA: hypothetical protein IAB58_00670 [Candidatus Pelethosoma merdigallinarum]|nr:hypothetical protein [Candidatus Pelethosoma merdigallinarum]
MITEEDIKKIQSELTDDQLRQLLYLLQKDKLVELKELARKKCKTEFVMVMRRYVNKFFKELENDKEFKRPETINLLNQTRKTLKNVHKFINSKEVVDANSLLRSAFENLIMGMMINKSENTYKEFINLSIDDTTRQYTKPQKLRNDFRKVLRKLDGDLFIEMSNRNLKDMLDEFYDKMCLFTHSTILVNAMIEIEKDDDLGIYVIALKQNTYFVEMLLYLCLKYLCNYKKDPIDITYVVLGWYVLISDVPKEKVTPEKMEKLNKLLYADFNKEYLEKNKENVDFLTEEAKKLQENIQKNPTGFVELLTKLVK